MSMYGPFPHLERTGTHWWSCAHCLWKGSDYDAIEHEKVEAARAAEAGRTV